MRKIYKLSIACIISFNAQAQTQLSNSSFENWELDQDNVTLVPTDWSMPGACISFTGNPTKCAYTANKESDPSLGSYSIKVFSKKETSGNVSYGTFSSLTNSLNGHNISGRPTSISMDLKFYSSVENKLKINNILYTSPSNLLDENLKIIAELDTVLSTGLNSLTFTRVTLAIPYLETSNPQYSYLRFDFQTKPTVGGEFYVIDNIVYNYGPNSLEEEVLIENKKVARIMTVTGIEINETEATNGLYIYQFTDGSTKKIMKMKF